MDNKTTQPQPQPQQARQARKIVASKGPKRLAFQIGKPGPFGGARRGTILLITNRFGVWSLRRWRYVKKARSYRFFFLKKKAPAIEKLHASLRRLGMRSWPEYDVRVGFLRKKLADAYWATAPAQYRERAAAFLLAARQHRHERRVSFCFCVAVYVAHGLFVAWWSAVVPPRIMVLYIAFCICLFYKPVVNMWRFTFHEPDVIVRMLEKVS